MVLSNRALLKRQQCTGCCQAGFKAITVHVNKSVGCVSNWFSAFRHEDTINHEIVFFLLLFGVSVVAMLFTIQGKAAAAAAKLRKCAAGPAASLIASQFLKIQVPKSF